MKQLHLFDIEEFSIPETLIDHWKNHCNAYKTFGQFLDHFIYEIKLWQKHHPNADFFTECLVYPSKEEVIFLKNKLNHIESE